MCIGLSVLGTPIMLIYGGTKYIAAGTTMSLFSLRYLLVLCDLSLANQVIFIHKKEVLLTKLYFIGGGINLVLNALLAVFGIVGPEALIITTLLSEIILISLMTLCIKNKIDSSIHILNKYTLRYLITALLFYPIGYIIAKVMKLQYILNLKFIIIIATIIVACSIFYIVVLLICKDESLNRLLKMIFNNLKIKRK